METIEQILEQFYNCCEAIDTVGNSNYSLSIKFTQIMGQLSHRAQEIPATDLQTIRENCLVFSTEVAAMYMTDYLNTYFETSLAANHPLLGNLNDFAAEINHYWNHENGLNLSAATILMNLQNQAPTNSPRFFNQAPQELNLNDLSDLSDLSDLESDDDSVDSFIQFRPRP
jgi:hypothetical protein